MEDFSKDPGQRRHRGRPPGTHSFRSIEEKRTFFNYIRYVIVYDKAMEFARSISRLARYPKEVTERLLHQQTQARQKILAIIKKPGGIADKIYAQEVHRLYKNYCDKTVIPDIRTFEDKMYARVHPKYMDTLGRAIFWSVAERIYGGRDASDGRQPYVVSQGRIGIRSRESRAYIKLASLLRSYISTLANHDKVELGLTNTTGRFSPPPGQSNWRHNEVISLDAPATGSDNNSGALIDTMPGLAVPFKEFKDDISNEFPPELKEYIFGIIVEISSSYLYNKIDPEALSKEELAGDIKSKVYRYARERLEVCEELDAPPDEKYWRDETLLDRIAAKITAEIGDLYKE